MLNSCLTLLTQTGESMITQFLELIYTTSITIIIYFLRNPLKTGIQIHQILYKYYVLENLPRIFYYISDQIHNLLRSSGFEDELLWSAVWLYRATGKSQYLTRAEHFINQQERIQESLKYTF